MLNIGRKVNEAVRIGDSIRVVVTRIERGKVRIGIEAPDEVKIFREELLDRVRVEERREEADE